MRSLILGAAAVLSLALGMVHPQSAKAAETVTCKPYIGSGTSSWPEGVFLQVCNGSASPAIDSGDANAVLQAFEDLPINPKSAGTLIKNSMISLYTNGDSAGDGKGLYGVVYLFYSPTQYTEWATANEAKLGTPLVPGSASADTAVDGTTYQAYYTAIWKMPTTGYNDGDGTGGFQILTPLMVHEFGHWADYLMKGVASQSLLLSNSGVSGIFGKEYSQDLASLDAAAVYPCSPQNMNAGVFAGRADSFVTASSKNAPYYICDGLPLMGTAPLTGTASTGNGPALNPSSNTKLHPNYAGETSNGAVLQAAWPYFYKPGYVSTTIPYAEFFAETFNAAITGGAGYSSLSANWDAYYGTINNWSGLFCSVKWVEWVETNGTLPTSGTNNNYYAVNGVANPNNCPF